MGRMTVVIETTSEMLGTVSKSKEVYAKFIRSKLDEHKRKHPDDQQETASAEEELAAITEDEDAGWTGFRVSEEGLFLPAYMLRGFLKEAAIPCKERLKIPALSARITSNVFVAPRELVPHLSW